MADQPTPPASSNPQSRGEHRPFRRGPRPEAQQPPADRPGVAVPDEAKNAPVMAPLATKGGRPTKRELDAQIEAELAAALSGLNVEGELGANDTKKTPAAPKLADGKKRGFVTSIRGQDVFVEMPGNRTPGMINIQQFEGNPPAVGQQIEFVIERYDGANGLLHLNLEGAAQSVANWSSVQVGMTIEVKVTGVNKGGLQVEVAGIRGFLPMGQIDIGRVEQPEILINSKLKCVITECNPQEKNLVVSRKYLLEKERAAKAEEFWQTIEVGQVMKGIVRNVKPFGVFVDLGAADGLIPMSEISWNRVEDTSTLFKIGQSLEVKIARLDRDTRKIGLSLKALHTNPWDEFAKRARPGLRMMGKITRIMDFGAFVELEPGIEGLIHVSELSTQRVKKVRDVVAEGQDVEVQIQTLDPEQRRIGLSLKAISSEKESAERALQLAAEEAEAESDSKAAAERMANRKPVGNLRGGIGGGKMLFGAPE